MNKKFYTIAIVTFVILSMAILALKDFFSLHLALAMGANLFMFLISTGAYKMVAAKATHSNPNKLVNGMMASTFFRLMTCCLAMLIVIYIFRGSINKSNYFLMFVLYFVYTTIDTIHLMKLSKKTV